jgi:hypothetical protein
MMRIAVNTQAITEFQERNTSVFGMSIIPLLPKVISEATFVLLDENDLFPELKLEPTGYYTNPEADVYFEVSGESFYENTPGVIAVLGFEGSTNPENRW